MEDKKQKINASFCSILGALVEDAELRLVKEKACLVKQKISCQKVHSFMQDILQILFFE